MAEVLGVVASGVSIAQLTGQIAKSIIRLKGFWDQVKDAPDEISCLIKDLEVLNDVFRDLEPRETPSSLDFVAGSGAFRQSLTLCREATRELCNLADSLNVEIASSRRLWRTRGCVKMIIKRDKIKRYKSRLKSAITLLSVSHQCYTRAIAQSQFEVLLAALPAKSDHEMSTFHIMPSASNSSPMSSENLSPIKTLYSGVADRSRIAIESESNSSVAFEIPFVGSIVLFQKPLQKYRSANWSISRRSECQMIAIYREPVWLSYRTWQLCCLRSQIGWTWNLTTYNVIPDSSLQFSYAKTGRLAELKTMIAEGKASIFDQRTNGTSLLSMAALYSHIDTCKWLLKQGAHTQHLRFGSILNEILYYGGWMSFFRGRPMFEIVRILQNYEDFDIFDCADNVEGHCAFYGRKEVLSWLIKQSIARSYDHTVHDFVRLALNIARNIEHNSAELVKIVLTYVPQKQALQIKDQDGITLLHRVASRLGGSFAYEHGSNGQHLQAWDEGFDEGDTGSRRLLPREKWRSLLCSFNLDQVNLHVVSSKSLTPMIMGFRTLIGVWFGSDAKLLYGLSHFLELWLSSLAGLGICLLSYGKEERRLLDEGFVEKDFYRWFRGVRRPRDDSYGVLRLISFEPNASADQWKLWWSDPSDEFAGDFWRMCEKETIRMPGTWDEEFD